jgi:hypothetical protein
VKGMTHDNDRRNAAVGCACEIDEAKTGVVETNFVKVVFEVQLSQGHVSIGQKKTPADRWTFEVKKNTP